MMFHRQPSGTLAASTPFVSGRGPIAQAWAKFPFYWSDPLTWWCFVEDESVARLEHQQMADQLEQQQRQVGASSPEEDA